MRDLAQPTNMSSYSNVNHFDVWLFNLHKWSLSCLPSLPKSLTLLDLVSTQKARDDRPVAARLHLQGTGLGRARPENAVKAGHRVVVEHRV